MSNDMDRLFRQYSQPVTSWPGEEWMDDEARANHEASQPQHGTPVRPDEAYRGAFLPRRVTTSGEREWAVPGFLQDIWDTAKAISETSGFGTGPAIRFSSLPQEQRDQIISHGMAGALSPLVTTGFARAALAPRLPVGEMELGAAGARRPSTPPLPMDEASQAARAEAMKMDLYNPWYHGTTHVIDAFDPKKGNPEGYLGKSIYLTSSPSDASRNYAGMGPDLSARIDHLAEKIMADKGWDFPWGSPQMEAAQAAARKMAKEEIAGPHDGAVMPIVARTLDNKILDLRPDGTVLDFSPRYTLTGGFISDSPLLTRVARSLENQARKYDDIEPSRVVGDIADRTYGETVAAKTLDDALRESEGLSWATDANGNLVAPEIIRQVYQDMGYRGALIDASRTFPRMQMPPGTKHLMMFKPHDLRSTAAVFDPVKVRSPNLLSAEKPSIPGTILDEAMGVNRKAPSAGFVEPPEVPARPFSQDYPAWNGKRIGDPLPYDMEGTPLGAKYIAGRREVGGPDHGLSYREIGDIARRLTGDNVRFATPEDPLMPGSVAEYIPAERRVLLDPKLAASPESMARSLAHETAHAIDIQSAPKTAWAPDGSGVYHAAVNPIDQVLNDQARVVYSHGSGGRPVAENYITPEGHGYKGAEIPVELSGEAIRAYMRNPAYVKAIAPDLARRIRAVVNSHPEVSKVIQFNAEQPSIPGTILEEGSDRRQLKSIDDALATYGRADGGAVSSPDPMQDMEGWAKAVADDLHSWGSRQAGPWAAPLSFGADTLAEFPETIVSGAKLGRAPGQWLRGEPIEAGFGDALRVGLAAAPIARPFAQLFRAPSVLGHIPIDRTGAAQKRIKSLLDTYNKD